MKLYTPWDEMLIEEKTGFLQPRPIPASRAAGNEPYPPFGSALYGSGSASFSAPAATAASGQQAPASGFPVSGGMTAPSSAPVPQPHQNAFGSGTESAKPEEQDATKLDLDVF